MGFIRKCGNAKHRRNDSDHMMYKMLILSSFLLQSCTSALGEWTDNFGEIRDSNTPNDVREFIIERQMCDHLRGEEGYDTKRAKFLKKNIKKLCTGSDVKLYTLRIRYDDNEHVKKILSIFDDCIEYSQTCITKLE